MLSKHIDAVEKRPRTDRAVTIPLERPLDLFKVYARLRESVVDYTTGSAVATSSGDCAGRRRYSMTSLAV